MTLKIHSGDPAIESLEDSDSARRYAERLIILHEIDQSILAARSPETIALAALGRLRRLIPFQRAVVVELSQESGLAILAAESDGTLRIDIRDRLNLLWSEVTRNKHSHGVADLQAVVHRTPWQDLIYHEGTRTCLVLPLVVQDELIGALVIESTKANIFEAEHIEPAVEVAAVLAVAIQQARLYDTIQKRVDELALAKQTAEAARLAAEAANQAKSAFLANISHELRTPLNAILGFAQLMHDAPELTPDQRHNLKIIEQSGEHLAGLINGILEISKIEAGQISLHIQDMNLYDLIISLQEMFQLQAESKRLALSIEVDPLCPQYIRADEGKLRQVLINLLDNAVKFTHAGRVELRVSPWAGSVHPAASRLHFEVEDTGPGIPSEELAGIFTPFAQSSLGRQQHGGTGLGLPLSRQFVRLMGGDLTVHSVVGKGTTFSFDVAFRLTEAVDAARQQSERYVVGIEPRDPPYRVLIVDDETISRVLLTKMLAPMGFELKEASDGQEAVEIAQAWRPDIIWMDMRMPVMDGYEATRRIKASPQGKETVIIALTAAAFEQEINRGLDAGCNAFIRKPFHRSEIYDALREHVGVHFVFAPTLPPSEPERDIAWAKRRVPMTATLDSLAPAWRERLRKATVDADLSLIEQLIAEIGETAPELAATLRSLAQSYDHDAILALLDGAPVTEMRGRNSVTGNP